MISLCVLVQLLVYNYKVLRTKYLRHFGVRPRRLVSFLDPMSFTLPSYNFATVSATYMLFRTHTLSALKLQD